MQLGNLDSKDKPRDRDDTCHHEEDSILTGGDSHWVDRIQSVLV